MKTRSGAMKRANKSAFGESAISTTLSLSSFSPPNNSTYILLLDKVNDCKICISIGYFDYSPDPNSDIYINFNNNLYTNSPSNLLRKIPFEVVITKYIFGYDKIKEIYIFDEIRYSIEYDSKNTELNPGYISYKIQNENKNTVLNKLDTLISEQNNQVVKSNNKLFDKGYYQILTDGGNGSLNEL